MCLSRWTCGDTVRTRDPMLVGCHYLTGTTAAELAAAAPDHVPQCLLGRTETVNKYPEFIQWQRPSQSLVQTAQRYPCSMTRIPTPHWHRVSRTRSQTA